MTSSENKLFFGLVRSENFGTKIGLNRGIKECEKKNANGEKEKKNSLPGWIVKLFFFFHFPSTWLDLVAENDNYINMKNVHDIYPK